LERSSSGITSKNQDCGGVSLDGTRSADRVQIAIPIEAIGTDLNRGRPFCHKGRTSVVSPHGAAIVLNYALATDQEFTIRCLNTNKEAEARVVGLISGPGNDLVYAVAFLSPEANPWGIEFPALTGSDDFGRVLLQCRVCQGYRVVQLNEIEIEVLEANQSIQQFCKSCSAGTSWKRAESEALQEPAAVQGIQTEKPVARPAQEVNKRKYDRIRTSVPACIRQPGIPEEIVICENVSRGGLRFRSSKPYGKGTQIEVAVPYSAGDGNIFVPARIVHVQDCGSFFRLGAAYLGVSGKQQQAPGYSRPPRLRDANNG
jgi:PilZ domain